MKSKEVLNTIRSLEFAFVISPFIWEFTILEQAKQIKIYIGPFGLVIGWVRS